MNVPKVCLAASLTLNLMAVSVFAAHRLMRNPPAATAVRQSLFASLTTEGSVVFLGDSLTEFCDWSELLGKPVLNRGIESDTTAMLLERIHQIKKARIIFVEIGVNDALQDVSVSTSLANYRHILSALRSDNPEAVIYIESVLPTRNAELNRWSDEFNAEIGKLADGQHVKYLDVRSQMRDTMLTPDGIHLNASGYRAWQAALTPLVH